MKKYGIQRPPVTHCPDCGENMSVIDGRPICLECEKDRDLTDKKIKLNQGAKQPPSKRWQ